MEKSNLKYIICSGNAIGYKRFGGILPWDDDLDIFLYPTDKKVIEEFIKGNYKERRKLL